MILLAEQTNIKSKSLRGEEEQEDTLTL